MALQMTRTAEKAQIRGLLEGWAKAARANDIEGTMSYYAPDILSFDAIAQLQFKGADAYRKHWETCLAMCPGPMVFEVHDLSIEVGDGIAFGHYLLRCGATGEDGKEQVGWMRVTVCCRKAHGRWKIVHEHPPRPSIRKAARRRSTSSRGTPAKWAQGDHLRRVGAGLTVGWPDYRTCVMRKEGG